MPVHCLDRGRRYLRAAGLQFRIVLVGRRIIRIGLSQLREPSIVGALLVRRQMHPVLSCPLPSTTPALRSSLNCWIAAPQSACDCCEWRTSWMPATVASSAATFC